MNISKTKVMISNVDSVLESASGAWSSAAWKKNFGSNFIQCVWRLDAQKVQWCVRLLVLKKDLES